MKTELVNGPHGLMAQTYTEQWSITTMKRFSKRITCVATEILERTDDGMIVTGSGGKSHTLYVLPEGSRATKNNIKSCHEAGLKALKALEEEEEEGKA